MTYQHETFPAGEDHVSTRSRQTTEETLTPLSSLTPPASFPGNPGLRSTTMDFSTIHLHGNLFVNYLQARRETFIDLKGWDLPQAQGMEFDQYDTPLCKWIVLHEYGEILAGIRLTPTTARCGQYTYMIKDAQERRLTSIPADLLFFKAPVHAKIWEATRLFVAPRVTGARRAQVQTILIQQMADCARSLGCSYIIGIVPAVFHRWCKRIGMQAFAAGPVMEIGGDRTQAAMMKMTQFGVSPTAGKPIQ